MNGKGESRQGFSVLAQVTTDFNRQIMAERALSLKASEEEMIRRVAKSIPLGGWGEPQEIARGVAFLCSPAATRNTGDVVKEKRYRRRGTANHQWTRMNTNERIDEWLIGRCVNRYRGDTYEGNEVLST